MTTKKKTIPQFASEDDKRQFWDTHDVTEFFEVLPEVVEFPKLKPSTRTITVRVSESMLYRLKVLANKRDVPYQSLLKIYLAEKIDDEYKKTA